MPVSVPGAVRAGSQPRLCDSCWSGVVLRGASESEERIYCRDIGRDIRMRVVECSEYSARGEPSLYDFRKIAWVIEVDSGRDRIGFLRATEWSRRNPDEELFPAVLDGTA